MWGCRCLSEPTVCCEHPRNPPTRSPRLLHRVKLGRVLGRVLTISLTDSQALQAQRALLPFPHRHSLDPSPPRPAKMGCIPPRTIGRFKATGPCMWDPVPGTVIAGPPGTPTPLAGSAHAPSPLSTPGTHVTSAPQEQGGRCPAGGERLADGAEAEQEPQGRASSPRAGHSPERLGFLRPRLHEAAGGFTGAGPQGRKGGGPRGMRLTQARGTATQHVAGWVWGRDPDTHKHPVSANPEA